MRGKSELELCCKSGGFEREELELALSRAVLISLHEYKKITLQQYNYAIKLLEKKYQRR